MKNISIKHTTSYLFGLLSIGLLLNACCKKDCIPPGKGGNNAGTELKAPATLTPVRDTYRIGDTITIRSFFSDEVFDVSSSKYFKLENFKFFPTTLILDIGVSPVDLYANDRFDLIVDTIYDYYIFTYSDGEISFDGHYNYEDHQYKLEFKIVPRQKGLYQLIQQVGIGVIQYRDIPGQCQRAKFTRGTVYINKGADNNIHLLEDCPDEEYKRLASKLKSVNNTYYPDSYFFYVK